MARTDVKGTKKHPKEDAAQIIEQMASEGYSRRNIAKALSVSYELFVAWLDKYPELSEAMQFGKDKEHKELHNALFTAAKGGNITAAIFLLKTRHGYREGDQSDTSNKVSITFNLPAAAQNADDYLKTIGSNRTLIGDE